MARSVAYCVGRATCTYPWRFLVAVTVFRVVDVGIINKAATIIIRRCKGEGRVGNSTFLYGDGLGDALSVSLFWLVWANIGKHSKYKLHWDNPERNWGLHSHTPISTVVKTLSILPNSKKINTKYDKMKSHALQPNNNKNYINHTHFFTQSNTAKITPTFALG